ncbi:hypothetical protein [Brachybacterium paraconglomeratum]|uniref:hypothetical protein n=1 Tax=Brachybacterium paraconglomeratum TaxID=173362 RepID=UPI0031ED8176
MHTTATRRSSRLLVMLAGLLMLVLVGAPSAYACDCMELTFEEAAANADLIADITIESEIEDVEGEVTYFAVVDTVWKGEESRTIEFTTHEWVASCGLGRIEAGTSLLVWASGEDGSYSSTWCALPADGGPDDPERLTELLGDPADLTDQPIPQPGEPGGPPEQSRPAWVIISVAAVALGIWGLLVPTVAIVLVSRHERRRRR